MRSRRRRQRLGWSESEGSGEEVELRPILGHVRVLSGDILFSDGVLYGMEEGGEFRAWEINQYGLIVYVRDGDANALLFVDDAGVTRARLGSSYADALHEVALTAEPLGVSEAVAVSETAHGAGAELAALTLRVDDDDPSAILALVSALTDGWRGLRVLHTSSASPSALETGVRLAVQTSSGVVDVATLAAFYAGGQGVAELRLAGGTGPALKAYGATLEAVDLFVDGAMRVNSDPAVGWFTATPRGQAVHIARPAGGTTVDTEARAAMCALLDALESFGLVAAL